MSMERYKKKFKESSIPQILEEGKKYMSNDGETELHILKISVRKFNEKQPLTMLNFDSYNKKTGNIEKDLRTDLSSFRREFYGFAIK